jgi:alanyl aminopeptidase
MRALALVFPCACAVLAFAQTTPIAVPGLRLPRNVAPLDYDARLRVDPASDTFSGEVDITVRVFEPGDLVWLNARHLKIADARATPVAAPDETISATAVSGSEDVVALSFNKVLPAGEVRLTLKYTGAVESTGAIGLFRQQEDGRWYALTQFEPMDARAVFPCFDEPDRKATWRLTLTVPSGMRAFANMPVDAERQVDARWREVSFRRTPPLPSYLIAFAVGDFDVRDGGRAGMNQTPISIIAPKGRGGEAAYAAANTGAILAAAERYFGQPYPFPKLDLIAYPKSTFGGAMENPGLITFSARLLLARPDEMSPVFEQRMVGVTAHEIAHMWFGDYVTPAWWNDIWLNESFASWLGTRIVREVRPQWPNTWRTRQRTKAIELDQLAGARTLRQPVTENAEVRAAFDSITYAKGEVLLGMFEQWLGPDKFRDAIRKYVAKYAWANATADDFMAALGKVDPAAAPAFRSFAERSGIPLVDVALDCSRAPELVLAQQRLTPTGSSAPSETWVFPACFDFGDAKKGAQVCTVMREAKQTLALPTSACPQWVVANKSGVGYYLPRLSPALYAALPKADRVLTPSDFDALLGDLAMLAAAGAVGYDAGLAIAARQAGSADVAVARRATDLAASIPDPLIDPANRARYAAFVRHHFGDRARALGWLPQPNEALEVARLRETLPPFVAVRGDDAALARKAQQLAQRWLTHRSAIPPSARRTVLLVAARTSDKDAAKLFDALYAIATRSTDPNEREDVHAALGGFRDAALLGRALGLLLGSGAGHDRYAIDTLEEALDHPVTRPITLTWMNGNAAALFASIPPEQQSEVITWSGHVCTNRERLQFVALWEARAPGVDGGARRYRQALEKIDACIALRRIQQAPFNAFLSTAQ